jgi:hypothetical protein
MNIQSVTLVATALLVAVTGSSSAGEGCCPGPQKAAATNAVAKAEAKAQTTCPVMGGPVNKNIFVDAEGKRIYLCCKGCIDPVKKDPKKYIAKLEAEGVTLDKTPVETTPPEKATTEKTTPAK